MLDLRAKMSGIALTCTGLPEAVAQDIERYVHMCLPDEALGDVSLTLAKPSSVTLSALDLSQAVSFTLPLYLPHLCSQLRFWAQQAQKHELQRLAEGCQFDTARRMLVGNDLEQGLTDKEARLLELLLAAAPEVLSRTHVLESVWSYDEQIDTRTLETHIYRLRQKLEPFTLAEKIITQGDGYGWQG